MKKFVLLILFAIFATGCTTEITEVSNPEQVSLKVYNQIDTNFTYTIVDNDRLYVFDDNKTLKYAVDNSDPIIFVILPIIFLIVGGIIGINIRETY